MRQIWITKVGLPEVLEVKQAPDPEPKAGEVRGRLGLYPHLPPSRSCLVVRSAATSTLLARVSHPIGLAVMFWQRLDLAATPML
jgi:hypothetical protein